MPTIVMFWDEVDIFGNLTPDIRIEGANPAIEVPTNACGFRLGKEGEDWWGTWYFYEPGKKGKPFEHQGLIYASWFTGKPSPSAISARGPVRGCAGSNGTYEFVTPMPSFGGDEIAAIIHGGGGFIAEFTDEQDVQWLDSAGSIIELDFPDPHVEPGPLPPEFFEIPPKLIGCFRDFENKLQCPVDADTSGQAAPAGIEPPSPGVAYLISKNQYLLPNVKVVEQTDSSATSVASGEKVEVVCPAELQLTVTFVKNSGVDPAIVDYRFSFTSGPVSTVFSKLVEDDGPTTVVHSVPIPLPKPVGPSPQGGVSPGSNDVSIFVPPVDPGGPIGPDPGPASGIGSVQVEALPSNEIKDSVQVQVMNGHDGIIVSGYATFHLVCLPNRPRVTPGLIGPDILNLQAATNQWLITQRMDRLRLDGVFGPRTEEMVRKFQESQGLEANGIVDARTWRKLLMIPIQEGRKYK